MAAGTAPSLPPRHGKKGSVKPQTLSPKGTRAPFRACRGEDPAAQAGSRPLRVAASSPAPAFASLPTPAGGSRARTRLRAGCRGGSAASQSSARSESSPRFAASLKFEQRSPPAGLEEPSASQAAT